MKKSAGEKEIEALSRLLESRGLGVHLSQGSEATIVGIIGDKSGLADVNLELLPGVEK